MKKIISLLLVLVCAVSIVSCTENGPDHFKAFNDANAATSPSTVTLTVQQVQVNATLNATFNITYNEDGSSVIVYSRDEFAPIGSGSADSILTTVTGTVTCDKNGVYSDGGEFAGTSTVVTGTAFNFDSSKMTATFSTDGNVLNATISAENTVAVLGVAIANDVTLTVTKNADKIVSFTIEYTATEGPVYINCIYG